MALFILQCANSSAWVLLLVSEARRKRWYRVSR